MKGAVTFAESARTAVDADPVTFVGDFTVVEGTTTNMHSVSGSGETITVTDAALADFRSKINSIARGRHERITG